MEIPWRAVFLSLNLPAQFRNRHAPLPPDLSWRVVRGDVVAALMLWGPAGADHAAQWQQISESFKWD